MARRDYNGRTVVITGAAGGLGRAFAERFGAAGARLGLIDLAEEAVIALADELTARGVEALGLGLDITDLAACNRATAEIEARFDGLDVLVNNAGISHRSLFIETETAVIERIVAVNLFGSVNMTKAALDSLIARRGQIVVISTVAGFAPLIGRTGYAASKHALHGFFDTLRSELRNFGVGVTIVCPGFTKTPLEQRAMGGDGRPAAQAKKTVGRVSTPEETAEAVFRAAAGERRLVVLTGTGKLSRLVSRFWPPLYDRLMIRAIGPEFETRTAPEK